MKTIFAITLGACCWCIANVYTHEDVHDTMSQPTLKENTDSLQKMQQGTANCTVMYFYIEDYEEDAEYIYQLSAAEVKVMKQLIASMSPCTTNMEIDIDPSVYISLYFEDSKKKHITTLDELDVVPKSAKEADGSYPLGRFVLSDKEYAQWQSMLKHAMQHKSLTQKVLYNGE